MWAKSLQCKYQGILVLGCTYVLIGPYSLCRRASMGSLKPVKYGGESIPVGDFLWRESPVSAQFHSQNGGSGPIPLTDL